MNAIVPLPFPQIYLIKTIIISFLFVLTGCSSYKIKDGQMYYRDLYGISYDYFLIKNADISSFEKISDWPSYAKDKNNIYYRYKPIVGADVGSFTMGYFDGNVSISRDKNFVYNAGEKIEDADPSSFKRSTQSNFLFEDSKFVYRRYHKDKQDIIAKLPQLDVSAYEYLGSVGGLVIKDKYGVYVDENILAGADPETFEIINFNGEQSQWQKDKHNYYWQLQKVKINDSDSFEVTGFNHAHDKTTYYYQSKSFPKDKETFRYLLNHFNGSVIDKNGLIFSGYRYPELNSNSFEMVFRSIGCDNKRIYEFSFPHFRFKKPTYSLINLDDKLGERFHQLNSEKPFNIGNCLDLNE